MSVWNPGLGRAGGGVWAHHLLYTIHLLVGKIASPGNGPLCLSGQPNGGSSVHDAGTLAHTLPRGLAESEEDRRRAARIWGVPFERMSQRPGRAGLTMFDALERGDIRFLWIQATNPMVSLPDLARYRQAASRDGRFIVVTEAYPTPTSEVADVVLPAAMWFEREGLYANVERRIQHFAPLVAPPGDATSDGWLMIEVARRLGHGKLFPWDARTHVEQIWAEYRRFHDDSATALPPLDVLRADRGIQWPHVGGRSVRWRYNAAHDPHAEPGRGGYDFYGHADHRAWVWLMPPPQAGATRDPAFPLRLVTGPVLEHWGGGAMTQRVAVLHHALPHAYLELNREDARRIGIRNREMVRVSSARGSLEIEARIEYRSQPPRGQVFVPTFDENHPINRLITASSDPVSGEPTAACAVRVERVGNRSGG
jgi:nitrate reductase NapA